MRPSTTSLSRTRSVPRWPKRSKTSLMDGPDRGRRSDASSQVSDDARHLRITERAERDLKQLPARDQARVRAALDGLTTRPPTGDIRKLQGVQDEWRLRVGDWRVRFRLSVDGRSVDVLRVLPRGRAYRD